MRRGMLQQRTCNPGSDEHGITALLTLCKPHIILTYFGGVIGDRLVGEKGYSFLVFSDSPCRVAAESHNMKLGQSTIVVGSIVGAAKSRS